MKILALLVMLGTASRPASGQSETTSYLRSVVHVGQVIWITGPDGHDLKGIVASISDTAFEVKMAGRTVPYRMSDVRLIEVPEFPSPFLPYVRLVTRSS